MKTKTLKEYFLNHRKQGAMVILLLMLCSCGARHINKDKSQVKTQIAILDTTKTTTKDTTHEKVVDNSVIDSFIIEPKDTTKPIEIDGHIFKNVVIKHKKKQNNIVVDKSKKVTKTEQKAVVINKTIDTKNDIKIVDKEQFNFSTFILSFWWLWLLIILAGLIYWKRLQIIKLFAHKLG